MNILTGNTLEKRVTALEQWRKSMEGATPEPTPPPEPESVETTKPMPGPVASFATVDSFMRHIWDMLPGEKFIFDESSYFLMTVVGSDKIIEYYHPSIIQPPEKIGLNSQWLSWVDRYTDLEAWMRSEFGPHWRAKWSAVWGANHPHKSGTTYPMGTPTDAGLTCADGKTNKVK